ncbi:MAG: MATE family efflux transporter [Chloroflexia bacterium]
MRLLPDISLPRQRSLPRMSEDGRTIDRLAWPIIGDGLFQTVLDLTNLALVGRLGTAALGGVGAATQLIQLGVAALGAVSVGGMVLAAQARGAQDARQIGKISGQSLLVSLAIGLAIGVPALLFAPTLLHLIGTSAEVTTQGAIYLRFVGAAFPALAVLTVAAAILRALGNSRIPMYVTGLTNLINVGVTATLLYGPTHLGVAAAGIGSTVARVSGAALLVTTLWRSGSLRGARYRPEKATIRRILDVGLPSLGEQLLLNFGMLAYGLVALRLGTAAFAAQRVVLTMSGVMWMPSFGYGAATTALVGQAVGAGEAFRARVLAKLGAIHSVVSMFGLAAFCFIFAPVLMGFFTTDPAVRAEAAAGLRALCFGQPFWGLSQVYAGALRGSGDTRFPLWATAVGVWCVRVPFAYVFGLTLGFGLAGICFSSAIDAATRASIVIARFQRRKSWS